MPLRTISLFRNVDSGAPMATAEPTVRPDRTPVPERALSTAPATGDGEAARAPRVLLVEDDDGDATLVAEGLREAGSPVELTRVADGVAALQHLEHVAVGVTPPPDLVLLDLNLPGLSGVEVLRRIKLDSRIAATPVVVLSTSNDPGDVQRVYAAHGNAFVTKPMDLTAFLDTVARVHDFWMETAQLPGGCR